MNSFQRYTFSFLLLLIGLAAADSNNNKTENDAPKGDAHISSTSLWMQAQQNYSEIISCDYTYLKPAAHNSEDDWELAVSFHKEEDRRQSNGSSSFPVVVEYRRVSNSMVFHRVKPIEGLNIWPKDGPVSPISLKMFLVVIPLRSSPGDELAGQWKCSLMMKLKGSKSGEQEEKYRFMSNTITISAPPSN